MAEALEIIDPHMHLWDPRTTPRSASILHKLVGWNDKLYRWLAHQGAPRDVQEFVGKLEQSLYPHSIEDFESYTNGLPVRTVVHVQNDWMDHSPLGPAGETRWIEQVVFRADAPRRLKLGAIVGQADLTKVDTLPALLDAHQSHSPRFVAIRDMLAWNADPGVWKACRRPELSRDPQWRKGFAMLAQRGLSFDAWVYHPQLDELSELAASFPQTQINLCHMGTPLGLMGPFAGFGHTVQQREATRAQWQASLARLAANPNVAVKLSGMFMPVIGWGLHRRGEPATRSELVERVGPLIEFVIEQFGWQRCMFASNFPVDRPSLSYQLLYEVYLELVKQRPLAEQRALFADNARRIYKIQ